MICRSLGESADHFWQPAEFENVTGATVIHSCIVLPPCQKNPTFTVLFFVRVKNPTLYNKKPIYERFNPHQTLHFTVTLIWALLKGKCSLLTLRLHPYSNDHFYDAVTQKTTGAIPILVCCIGFLYTWIIHRSCFWAVLRKKLSGRRRFEREGMDFTRFYRSIWVPSRLHRSQTS